MTITTDAPEAPSFSNPPSFSAWLLHQYRPGATYPADPVAALAADVGRAGRLPKSPAALGVHLQKTGASPTVHAAAALAARQYARTVQALRAEATEAAR
jgi:hypothetical protein